MSYSSTVLATSGTLYGYWRLGESSGTSMVDSSGAGRNGTYVASPGLGATGLLVGDSDTAVTSNGGVGTVADDDGLDGITTLTIVAIIKPSVATAGQIVARDGGSSNRSFQFALSSSKLSFVKIPAASVTANSATTIVAGTTYHVAAVLNGTDIRLYINGVLDGTPAAMSASLGTVAQDLAIGRRGSGSSFGGDIDEVAVWTTALTSTQIATLYTAATSGGGTAASGSAALTLSASGAGKAAGTGSASLSLSASGTTKATGAGSAALSLSGSGTAEAPGDASGSASLSLSASGTGTGSAPASASASLSLSATGSASTPGAGSAAMSLSASADTAASTVGTAALSLTASGTAHRPRTTYADYVLDDGPVGFWRLGDAVDTGFPSTAADSSIGGHDGTFGAGAASTTPGALLAAYDDGCLYLDAVTNTLTVPYFAALNFTTFSIEAWIQVSSVPSYNPLFGRVGGSFAPFEVGNNAGGQIVVKIHNGTTSATYTSVSPAWHAWHHVVITRDGSGTLSIYIDRVLDAQFAGALAPNTATHGGLTAGTDGLGFLDELALYDYALTGAQIADHYVAGHGEVAGAVLTLSASGHVTGASSAGAAILELFGIGTADAIYETDTSNLLNGRVRRASATSTVERPVGATPSRAAVKYDKAVPYPPPTLVDGRVQ